MLIGVDVTSIARVGDVVARNPRFVQRIYTPHEQERCAGKPQRWASSWAAKEAVRKLYSQGGRPMPAYRDIEVVRRRGRPPAVAVAGDIVPIALSLTHDAGVAIAVAAGESPPQLRADPPARMRLPERPDDAHKGTFGRVVVVAGARGYTGAPQLTAYGAARGGAGLVTLCVPESIYAIVATRCVEVMPQPLPDAATGALDVAAMDVLREQLRAADALVIGPGIGRSEATERALVALLRDVPCPVVADADALTLAARTRLDWRACGATVVLTPHPAEMARLAASDTAAVQRERESVAPAYAQQHGVTVVLKGSNTVIAAADGSLHVDTHRVVALATGGTGDVLAGLLGAFLAQQMDPFDAAVAAVTVHAEAGMDVQRERGRAGALASDVLDALPQAQERLRRAIMRRGSAQRQ